MPEAADRVRVVELLAALEQDAAVRQALLQQRAALARDEFSLDAAQHALWRAYTGK